MSAKGSAVRDIADTRHTGTYVYVISSLPFDSLSVEIVASHRPAHTRVGISTGRGKRYWAVCVLLAAPRYIHLNTNRLDAQFIFSVFRQTPLHVSGVSIAHHQEVHRMDTTVGTDCPF